MSDCKDVAEGTTWLVVGEERHGELGHHCVGTLTAKGFLRG